MHICSCHGRDVAEQDSALSAHGKHFSAAIDWLIWIFMSQKRMFISFQEKMLNETLLLHQTISTPSSYSPISRRIRTTLCCWVMWAPQFKILSSSPCTIGWKMWDLQPITQYFVVCKSLETVHLGLLSIFCCLLTPTLFVLRAISVRTFL